MRGGAAKKGVHKGSSEIEEAGNPGASDETGAERRQHLQQAERSDKWNTIETLSDV